MFLALFLFYIHNVSIHVLCLSNFCSHCSSQVNKTMVNIPVSPAAGVSVFKSGKHYTVSMNFGVTVRYDGNHFMDLKIIKE